MKAIAPWTGCGLEVEGDMEFLGCGMNHLDNALLLNQVDFNVQRITRREFMAKLPWLCEM